MAIRTFQCDAIDWLKSLESNSINLFITDPAYESLEKHRKIGTTTRLSHSAGSSNDWFKIFPNSKYQELFTEIYRVLDKNSHFYCFCDEETLFVIKPIAEACGFKFWKSLIWDKVHIGMGYHYRNRTERIAFFEKGKRKLNNLSMSDILTHKRVRNGYPTEKPSELLVDLIKQSSNKGEVVADCFFGSGVTLDMADQLGREAIGSDISDAAHEYLAKRVTGRNDAL